MAGRKEPIPVGNEPCASCPYRQDTPPGVWAAEEYMKLPKFAGEATPERVPSLSLFLCHHTPALGRAVLCRGWLSVERDSLAVRLGLIEGKIRPADVDAPVKALLYDSGAEACLMGLQGVKEPGGVARAIGARLMRARERARRRSEYRRKSRLLDHEEG